MVELGLIREHQAFVGDDHHRDNSRLHCLTLQGQGLSSATRTPEMLVDTPVVGSSNFFVVNCSLFGGNSSLIFLISYFVVE